MASCHFVLLFIFPATFTDFCSRKYARSDVVCSCKAQDFVLIFMNRLIQGFPLGVKVRPVEIQES